MIMKDVNNLLKAKGVKPTYQRLKVLKYLQET